MGILGELGGIGEMGVNVGISFFNFEYGILS